MSQRQAGIFSAPPEMYQEIREWMVSTYAGHILAGVRQDLIKARDALAPVKHAASSVQHSLSTLQGAIRGLDIGKAVRFPVFRWNSWSKVIDTEVVGVRRKGDDLYEIGYGEKSVSYRAKNLPREFWGGRKGFSQDEITQRVTQFFQKRLKHLEQVLAHPEKLDVVEDTTLIELALLERMVAKYASQEKAYKTSTKKKFRISVAGWEYIDDAGEAHAKLKDAGWDKITAVLDFHGTQYKGGHWDRRQRVLNVELGHGSAGRFIIAPADTRTVEGFRYGISEIERVLRHELQHVGQDILAVIRDMSEDAGLPSRSLRNLEYNPSGVSLDVTDDGKKFVKTHPLRDVEFYTRLADEVSKFVQWSRRVPLEMRREAMRVWVAASPQTKLEHEGETITATQQFFYSLKKYEQGKWKKAVAEFFDEVAQQINLPADSASRLARRYLDRRR